MKKTILLVDDEEGIRKVLGIALADKGYEVEIAENGKAALQIFRKVRPSVVITDIKMPEMDGIELLRLIKQEDPDTEVIMITGHGDLDLAIKSVKYEATDFVTKPINDEILEIALNRASERIAMRQQISQYTQNLEQLVDEKSRKLVAAERMAAIGQTVAGLSHAIKNIAGGLKGGAFVLEKGIELNKKKYLMQGWEMIKGNVGKITNLSMDLLNYAKTTEIKYQTCHPNQPAQEVFELMKLQAHGAGIDLACELNPDLVEFDFDPELIHRCLLNLVSNALDACRGELSGNKKKTVSIVTAPADGWGVEYQVIDSCCGMDPEIKAKIFQSFFTTKGAQGTGIGLMITKKIVDEHNGTIEFESRKGSGSKFVLRLPQHPKM
jgi:signal transduction histidine kinase